MQKRPDFHKDFVADRSTSSKVSTASMEQELLEAPTLDYFLEKNASCMIQTDLTEYLEKKLKQKGLKRANVIRESGLDRVYAYQIFDGTKKPSRDKLIAIAFGLHLTLEETQRMLKLSGNRELYVKDPRDAVIYSALQHNKSMIETNLMLYERSMDPLE